MKKPFLVFLLSLLLSACNPSGGLASFDPSTCQIAAGLKESIEAIVSARQDYKSPLSEKEILASAGFSNGDSILDDYDTLLRLLKGAFSSLAEEQEKIGSRLYGGYYSAPESVKSGSEKGKAAFDWFSSLGLWGKGDYDGTAKITTETTRTLLQRLFGYLGCSAKQDYFTYANSDRLFSSASKKTYDEEYYEQKIVDETNIASFYCSLMEEEAPSICSEFAKDVGLKSLKSSADKIFSSTASTFWDAMKEVASSTGSSVYTIGQLDENAEAGGSFLVYLAEAEMMTSFRKVKDQKESFALLYASFGYGKDESESLAEAFVSYLDATRRCGIDYDDYCDSFNSYLSSLTGGDKSFAFYDKEAVKTANYIGIGVSEETLLEAKAFGIASLAYSYRALLGAKEGKALGFFSSDKGKDDFYSATSNAFQFYAANAYSSSEKGKKSIERASALAEEAVSLIENRLAENDWLSKHGQEAVKDKLSALTFSIGATCQGHPSYAISVDTSSLENAIRTSLSSYWASFRKDSAEVSDVDELGSLYTNILTPNAFYIPTNNSVCITLGLMTSYGDYVSEMGEADFYGAFLTVLAHEITHSIDSQGIYFDAKGEQREESILGEDDLYAYSVKQDAVKLLHHFETLPGERQDPSVTLSEDLADIGGMAISEKLYESKASQVDWDAYFKSIARHFYSVCSFSSWELTYGRDTHSFGKGRVNPMMSNSSHFASYYGVGELDGMYVDPSKRVVIW